MACNDRQLTEAQRQAGYQQQRTGVVRAVRPFSGSPTVENLIDYINRELGPAVRASRDAVNECFLQVTDNAPSANPLAFYFSTSVAAADPTVGRIRLNQATQNTATVMRVSQSNARLVDVQPWLDVMAGGPTTPLGVVTLVDAINPARFIRWDLNTMTDQGAYWDLGLTVIESSDANPFVEDEAVVVGFISGVSAAGSTVPVGSLSPVARDTFLGNIGTATAAPSAVPLASVDSTSIVYDATAHEFQRAALTGFAAATQNSNATTSAEPIVTYSASSNMSAERVTTSSTSVTVSTSVASQIEFQRAALTGEATATANSNAVTVTRSTNFQSSPWTGDHQFNAELRLGTLHTESGATGALNITLTAGATRVLILSTGNVTLGTISGCADGRVLFLEHTRTSGAGNVTITHDASANGIACPVAEDFILGNRCSVVLVARGSIWRLAGVGEHGKLIVATHYSSASGTHSFNSRTRYYEVLVQAPGGGGGGANSAAGQCAVGASGGRGVRVRYGFTTVPASEDYDCGTAGTAGANTGGDGGDGADATWSSGASAITVQAGLGGEGSAHATRGSGSGTTLRLTGPGGRNGYTIIGTPPTGGTLLDIHAGLHGLPGVALSGTAGWGGSCVISTSSHADAGVGGLSINNVDSAGRAGDVGRISVWEYT